MDEPISGCRKVFIRWSYRIACFIFQFFSNFNFVTWKTLSMQDVNHYEEWLGPVEIQEQEQMEMHSGESEDEEGASGREPNPTGLTANASANNFLLGGLGDSTDISDNQMQSPQHNLLNSSRKVSHARRKIPKRGRGKPSTIVCNHICWIEVMGLIQSPLHPGFTPKMEMSKIPLVGTSCRGL